MNFQPEITILLYITNLTELKMKIKDMTIEEQMDYLLMYDKARDDNYHMFDDYSEPELVEDIDKAKEMLMMQKDKNDREERVLGNTFHHSAEVAYENGKRKYTKKQIKESEKKTNDLIWKIKEDWMRENKVSKVDADFSDFCWDLLDDENVTRLMASHDFTLDEQYLIYYIYCIKNLNVTWLIRKQAAFRGIKDTIRMYDKMNGKKFGYGDNEFKLSLNKSLYDLSKEILADEELVKFLDWTWFDNKANKKKAGKANAKAIEITFSCDNKILVKYGLAPGQEFASCSELAKFCGFSTSVQISKWKKLGYIKTKIDAKHKL